jgi:hypothetical protein
MSCRYRETTNVCVSTPTATSCPGRFRPRLRSRSFFSRHYYDTFLFYHCFNWSMLSYRTRTKRYVCFECPETFGNQLDILVHVRKAHCPLAECRGMKFNNTQLLSEHILAHRAQNTAACRALLTETTSTTATATAATTTIDETSTHEHDTNCTCTTCNNSTIETLPTKRQKIDNDNDLSTIVDSVSSEKPVLSTPMFVVSNLITKTPILSETNANDNQKT